MKTLNPQIPSTRACFATAAMALVGLLASANIAAADDQRFHGSEGIVIPDSPAEPTWWSDPVITVIADPTPEPSKSPEPASGPDIGAEDGVQESVAEPKMIVEILFPSDTLFASGSAYVDDAASAALTTAIATVGPGELLAGVVRCHTDDQGTAKYNLGLSVDRANAVIAAITDIGTGLVIDVSLVDAEGAGETDPKFDNTTESGRAQNRRCEIELTIGS